MSVALSSPALRLSGERSLDLTRPGVLAVLNVTPDSFSDGGAHLALADALAAARRMVAEGALALDVGGESTRPGAAPVSASDELARVLPVIEALAGEDLPVPLSIDTRKAVVADAALARGARIVNDVTGLGDPRMAAVVADHDAALILGHIQGDPRTMQRAPRYGSVVDEVYAALAAGCERAVSAGVAQDALAVDPGIGFGKTLQHNLALLGQLGRFTALAPVVVGISRKQLLGALTGRPTEERLAGGLGGAVACALGGARLIRAHDVAATVDALRVAWAIHEARA
ncbi:MAG: dihydropteroate synthase [Planctomycetota bacterium]